MSENDEMKEEAAVGSGLSDWLGAMPDPKRSEWKADPVKWTFAMQEWGETMQARVVDLEGRLEAVKREFSEPIRAAAKAEGSREERERIFRWLNAPGSYHGLIHQDEQDFICGDRLRELLEP